MKLKIRLLIGILTLMFFVATASAVTTTVTPNPTTIPQGCSTELTCTSDQTGTGKLTVKSPNGDCWWKTFTMTANVPVKKTFPEDFGSGANTAEVGTYVVIFSFYFNHQENCKTDVQSEFSVVPRSHIPEVPVGALMAMIACFGAAGVLKLRQIKTKKF